MNEDAISKLKFPAIGLIVTGVLNILFGLLEIVSNSVMYAGGTGIYTANRSIEYNVGIFIGLAIVVLSLLIAPFLIYGGVQMYRGKSYKISKIAAILAIVPLASCCFIFGVPFGIWALVILSKPEIRAAFEGASVNPYMPPPPPPNF